MKTILTLALAATALAGATAAEARDGCGRGFFRGPYGHCRPMYGPRPGVVVGGPLIVDTFYPGRGYWDGHRYWWHRDRWHGGWRYR